MVKHNLVIASVLKPVDDTRMYEKFGITLSSLSNYHVHIVGFSANKPLLHTNISFHPIFKFARLSYKRFLAPLKFYNFIYKVKPKVIIVNSPDLLIVSSLYNILFGAKLLYDVQENYYYNLLYTDVFRSPIKQLLAFIVRMIEMCCAPVVAHFFLAEQTYVKELPFIGTRFSVVENKYNPLPDHQVKTSVRKINGRFKLLYSGTIAASYGIFEAIALAKRLFEIDARYNLTIIGYCAKKEDYHLLLQSIKDSPFIRLIGGDVHVPHGKIIEAVQEADIGLICYRDNKSTCNRIPTKFYEYMYYNLPMVIPQNKTWKHFLSWYGAFIELDYHYFSALELSIKLQNDPFNYLFSSYVSIVWVKEPVVVLNIVNNLATVK